MRAQQQYMPLLLVLCYDGVHAAVCFTDCDILITKDQSISRRHATVYLSEGSVSFVPLCTTILWTLRQLICTCVSRVLWDVTCSGR